MSYPVNFWEKDENCPGFEREIGPDDQPTHWHRTSTAWTADGYWEENHAHSGERRWRRVYNPQDPKDMIKDPYGNPITIEILYTDPEELKKKEMEENLYLTVFKNFLKPGNCNSDETVTKAFWDAVDEDDSRAIEMFFLLLYQRPDLFTELLPIYLRSQEKRWEVFPGNDRFEMEIGREDSWNGWQRQRKNWDSNGLWEEINTDSNQKRWRYVSIDGKGNPLEIDEHGNPKTLSLHYIYPRIEY